MTEPVYVLKGTDPVLLGEAATTLVAELLGARERSEVVDEFSGDDYQFSAVVMAAASVSMFGDRLVVARNCGRFNLDDLAPFIAYLGNPNPTSTVVLVWDRPVAAGAHPSSVPAKLTAAVKAAGGTTRNTDAPGQAKQRQAWLDQRVADASVRLDPAARRLVVERLGEDVSRIGGLLSVLESSFDPGVLLAADDVEAFLGAAGGVPPWELTDAIERADPAVAVDRLHRMLGGGDRHPLQVMAILQTSYDRLLRLDGADVHGEADAAALLGLKGSTFPAKKALESARRLGSPRIARAVVLLADADVDLRGRSGWPPELVLEVLVARLARLHRR